MGQVLRFYEEQLAKLPKRQDQLAALRRFHHSVHEEERREAIELLAAMADADAARELVQCYAECQWRSTRFAILNALGRNATQRSLEFLFSIARLSDLQLAEAAIWSLGQTHHPMAARFLSHLYRHCPESLKPAVVGAIGQIPDHNLSRELLADLSAAVTERKHSLIKSLVLTVGELKAREATPLLLTIAKDRAFPELSLAAIVSLGKIGRDPSVLEELEPHYTRDLLAYQIFSGALAQTRLRAQWTLEDYLTKLFEGDAPDLSLPLELNAFSEADVREGLSLFQEPRHRKRLLFVMSRLDFPKAVAWYEELFNLASLPATQLGELLESLSNHAGSNVEKPLEAIRARLFDRDHRLVEPELFEKWGATVSLCHPRAVEVFTSLFESPVYSKLAPGERIAFVNHVVNHALTAQTDEAVLEKAAKLLVSMLKSEKTPQVEGRLLRAFGQLRVREEKASIFVKDHLTRDELSPSCLIFLEKLPHRKALPALSVALQSEKIVSAQPAALLRALTAQETVPDEKERLESFVQSCLAQDSTEDLKVEALHFLERHPLPSLFATVTAALAFPAERVQLGAITALRSYRKEAAASALAPFLRHPSPSLSGRALDTLMAIPGLPAKVLVIDLLKDRPDDKDVCDKIVRCLEPPEAEPGYFLKIVDEILHKYPEHPKLDGLLDLRERILAPRSATPAAAAQSIPDKGLLDASLARFIPSFARLDDTVKSSLRSAELPFVHKDIFEGSVDKASSILEFAKAVDLFLERHLGKKLLFPRLESSLHEFQNVLHAATLNEEFPSGERVLKRLALEKHFSVESFPLSKMVSVSRGILSGKILDERFKVLDGLRAWAVVMLLFCRKGSGAHSALALKEIDDAQIVSISKRLMALQDARNPAAHRQTYHEFPSVEEVRREVFSLLHALEGTI